MKDPVSIAISNARRMRELVEEFNATIKRKDQLMDAGGYNREAWERIESEQVSIAYKLVGCVEGAVQI